jgi:hypothetical protein
MRQITIPYAGRLAGAVQVLLLGAMTACSGAGGRVDIAAQAGQDSLPVNRLEGWVARVPSGRPSTRDGEFVGTVWVDYTLLARAATGPGALTGDSTVSAALMPDRALLVLRQWHDTLVARRPRVPAARVDSLYAGNEFRLFQQILLPIKDQQDVRAIAGTRAQADSILAKARAGADFTELVRARSQDSTGRADGYMPIARRGSLPPEFERIAWRIKEGDVGGVPSRFGLHVVRRPPLAQIRERFRQYAESLATRRADSLHLDSLTRARHLATTDKVVPVLRAFFEDAGTRKTATDPLVTWDGGKLALPELAIWIDMLPARAYLDLRGASDLTLQGFAKEIGQQQLLLQEARAAGITVAAADEAALDSAYRRSLGESLALLRASDSTAIPASEVPARVAALLDALTVDKVKWRPLPGALGAVMRARSGYRLHDAGIAAAVKGAQAKATPKRDSTPGQP